ncbi:hypothetical protein [Nocardiopsis coralli]|nr:hypothetical protein [Nocardiopsis coralli]
MAGKDPRPQDDYATGTPAEESAEPARDDYATGEPDEGGDQDPA